MKQIMKNTLAFSLIGFIGITACGSKKAATSATSENTSVAETSVVVLDKKPCAEPWGPADQVTTNKRNFAYMYGNFKEKDYKTALEFWLKVTKASPCGDENIYKIGEQLIDNLLKEEQDSIVRKKYIAYMSTNFKLRQEYFGNEQYVTPRWGYSLYEQSPTDYEQIMTLLDRAIELNGDTTETFVMFAYLNTAFRAYNDEKLSNDEMFSTYNKLTDIVDHNVDINADDSAELGKWVSLQKQLDQIIDKIGTCEDLINQYKLRMAENGQDVAFLNKVEKSLRAKRCTKDPLYIAVLEKLYVLDPSYDVALRLANYHYGSGNSISKGNSYMEKVISLDKDVAKNSDRYVTMASKALNAGNAAAAKMYTDRALDLNPNNGYAILQKGSLVYSSIRASCPDNFDKKAAAWVAMDYCIRAKNADGRVTSQANRYYASYAARTPSNEDKFMRSLSPGSTYTIKCAGYTATVR